MSNRLNLILCKYFVCLPLFVMVVSCGGGGDAPSNSNRDGANDPQLNNQPLQSIIIGEDVPSNSKNQIIDIITATATGTSARSATKRANGTYPPVIAINKNGEGILVAVGSKTGVLNASSTSVALVRFALGIIESPPNMLDEDLDKIIRLDLRFNNLEAQVSSALAIGEIPVKSESVISAVWSVAKNVSSTFPKNIGKQKLSEVELTQPTYLIDNSFEPFDRIWVEDVSGSQNVKVSNQTFIRWQIQSTNVNGGQLEKKDLSPLQSSVFQLAGYYGGSATSANLAGDIEFQINLTQTEATRKANVTEIIFKYITFVWSATASNYPNTKQNECFAAAAEIFVNGSLADVLNKQTGQQGREYLFGLLTATTTDQILNLLNCAPIPDAKGAFAKAIGGFWNGINLVKSGVAGVGATVQSWIYWKYDESFRMCKFNGALVSCEGPIIETLSGSCSNRDRRIGNVIVRELFSESTGIATGAVGSRFSIFVTVEGPNINTNSFRAGPTIKSMACPSWTLIADEVGRFSCQRANGQPQQTSWSTSTGPNSPETRLYVYGIRRGTNFQNPGREFACSGS